VVVTAAVVVVVWGGGVVTISNKNKKQACLRWANNPAKRKERRMGGRTIGRKEGI
jgi:hypothetical protein